MSSFTDLNLNTPLLSALQDLNFEVPTTIQKNVFPLIMSGSDVVGIAQTGTGKTIAYLLPCLRQWKFSKSRNPQILIVVPTRELVLQVVEEIEKLTVYMNVVTVGIYGGANINNQKDQLIDGLDILVATPGRLIDIALTGVLRLKGIKKFVIDEVDEMLNLGFRTQLIQIFDLLPQKRQNLMFSATLSENVKNLIDEFFISPQYVEAAPTGTPVENIEQKYYNLPNFYSKIKFLKMLLQNEAEFNKVMVFTSSRKLADLVYSNIEKEFPHKIGVIHSNKAQNNRFSTVRKFKAGENAVLIATDIVARGIDIAEVSHVINFDLPEVAETYMHRIGRTGRFDKKGIAMSLVSEKEEEKKSAIEILMNMEIPEADLPEDFISAVELADFEKTVLQVPNVKVKNKKSVETGPAFHDKKDKNKKVNKKITRSQQMKMKYKKPKTRGSKRK